MLSVMTCWIETSIPRISNESRTPGTFHDGLQKTGSAIQVDPSQASATLLQPGEPVEPSPRRLRNDTETRETVVGGTAIRDGVLQVPDQEVRQCWTVYSHACEA